MTKRRSKPSTAQVEAAISYQEWRRMQIGSAWLQLLESAEGVDGCSIVITRNGAPHERITLQKVCEGSLQ